MGIFKSTREKALEERVERLVELCTSYQEQISLMRERHPNRRLEADVRSVTQQRDWYKATAQHIAKKAEESGLIVVYPEGAPCQS